MKNISIIAAIGKNNELGRDNDLLWHIPGDLKRFKKITSGHMVIMGRKTFNSINNKPLLNRENVVISSEKDLSFPDVKVVHSIEEALDLARSVKEVFILGGAAVYSQFLPYTARMYLTCVHESYDADTFFPSFRWSDWCILEREDVRGDTEAGVDYSFFTLERKK
jgi:dihydrofolate reductase